MKGTQSLAPGQSPLPLYVQIRDDLRAFKQVMESGEVLFARKAERLEGEQQGLGALLPTPQDAQEVRV